MKIESGRGITSAGGPKRAGSAAAPGFSPQAEAAQKPSAATGVSGVTALDAILALQTDDPPAQKRARQARRGNEALDVLDKLEKALLMGRAPAELRAELDSAQRGAETTGEVELDAIMREIDIRLAVEAAKLDRELRRV